MSMKRKIYRGLEYHKYRIWLVLGGLVLLCLTMCKSPNNEVPVNDNQPDTTIVLDSIASNEIK